MRSGLRVASPPCYSRERAPPQTHVRPTVALHGERVSPTEPNKKPLGRSVKN